MFERFTDRARKVMALANQEAQRFNHEYVGTEHLLLGIVKEGSGVASKVLRAMNVDLRVIRLEVEKFVKSGPDMVTMGKLPQTPRAKKVVEYAIEESKMFGHDYVGTEHILLGLMRERDGVAAQVLINLSLNLDNVRDVILSHLSSPNQDEMAKADAEMQRQYKEAIQSADYEKAAMLRDQLLKVGKSTNPNAVNKPADPPPTLVQRIATLDKGLHDLIIALAHDGELDEIEGVVDICYSLRRLRDRLQEV